jgi:hypothetical protein
VTRAGGGAGKGEGGGGSGGAGGGGNGAAGTANTGGGGSAGPDDGYGFAGGKGVVIVRYLTAAPGAVGLSVSGGTSSTSGSYTIHTFNDTGSLVIS